MRLKLIIEKVKDLLAKGELENAIELLRIEFNSSRYVNYLVVQSSRVKKLHKEIQLGIINFEDSSIERNKIIVSILSLLDEIDNSLNIDNQLANDLLQDYVNTGKIIVNQGIPIEKYQKLFESFLKLEIQFEEQKEKITTWIKNYNELADIYLSSENENKEFLDIKDKIINLNIEDAEKLLFNSIENLNEKKIKIKKREKDLNIEISNRYYELYLINSMNSDYEKGYNYLIKSNEVNPEDYKILNKLGTVCHQLGKYEEAIFHFKKSSSKALEQNDLEHSYYVKNNLALLYSNIPKHFEEAYNIFTECIKYWEENHGLNNPEIPTLYANMSLLMLNHDGVDYYLFASKYAKKGYEVYLKTKEPNNDGKAYHLSKIANSSQALGSYFGEYRLYEAIDFYEKAKELYLLDGNYSEAGFIAYKIGTIHFSLEDTKKAKSNFNEATGLYEKAFPQGHVDRIGMALEYSILLAKLGQKEESGELLDKTISIFEKEYSDKNGMPIIRCLNNIAFNLTRLNRHEKAIEYYYKSIKKQKEISQNSVDLIGKYYNLSHVYRKINDLNNAIKTLEKAISYAYESLGKNHSLVKSYERDLNHLNELKAATNNG